MNDTSTVRVRFAPSPTGRFHIGSARTALYNYLLARQTGGSFILRIEDTDTKRFDPSAEPEIIDSMAWLGLEFDEGPGVGGDYGPYHQSQRKEMYQELSLELIDRGHAYYCFCSPQRLAQVRERQQKRKQAPRYDGRCRLLSSEEALSRVKDGESYVVRFKTPRDGITIATDHLRDPITVENANIDDYILVKSDGMPVYHLAAMADDHLMEITHVFRGSEWLPTFPLHVLIYEAFEWQQPTWVHLSLFLNPTGKGKLSKRHAVDPKQGVKSVYALDLREMGYLPEAVNNWVALMGWAYDDHTELFSMDELINKFSIDKLSSSPAAVNYSKLDHFNGIHIRGLSSEDFLTRAKPFFIQAGYREDDELLERIIPIIQERIRTMEEAVEIAGFFFEDDIDPPPTDLVGKNMSSTESAEAVRAALEVITDFPSMEPAPLEEALRQLAEERGLKAGQLFGILRIATTGQRISPPLIESMEILGYDEVLKRFSEAIEKLDTFQGDD